MSERKCVSILELDNNPKHEVNLPEPLCVEENCVTSERMKG